MPSFSRKETGPEEGAITKEGTLRLKRSEHQGEKSHTTGSVRTQPTQHFFPKSRGAEAVSNTKEIQASLERGWKNRS